MTSGFIGEQNIPRLHLSIRSLRRDECWATTAWWYIRLRPSTTNTSWRRENVNIRAGEQKALYRTKHKWRTHVWVEMIDHAPWLKLHGGLIFDALFPGFTLKSGAQTISQVTPMSLASADNRAECKAIVPTLRGRWNARPLIWAILSV